MTQQSIIPMIRPIPINPTLFPAFPGTLFLFQQQQQHQNPIIPPTSPESQLLVASTSSSSRCSSVESLGTLGKIRRGRPQQNIADGSDAHSQKKKHRRLYARQYRAEMRQKVDNVKSLSDDKQLLIQEVAKLRAQVANLQQELAKSNTLINFIELSKNIQFSAS